LNNYENIIVGGGFTGIISALKLRNINQQVLICEISDTIGGILRDFEHDGKFYFNSCQYISESYQWNKDLRNEFKNDLLKFNHTYGSYTDLFGYVETSKEFAGITIKNNNKLALSEKNPSTLNDRLSMYPENISAPIKKWTARYKVDLNSISSDGAIGLQISRIYVKEKKDEINILKKNSHIYDEMYGLPRRNLKLDEENSFLPKYGYTNFLSKIEKLISNRGIELIKKMPVIPEWHKDNLRLKLKTNQVSSNSIIWTCNPTALIRFFNKDKIDSIKTRMRIYVGDIDCKLRNPYYIQVYSEYTSITRIFIYQIDGISKITLECFDEEISIQDTVNHAQKILGSHGIFSNLDHSKFYQNFQNRYFLTTLNDKKIFNNFYEKTKNTNLICSMWDMYGRDEKIYHVLDSINNR
tara:strand:- start:36001 stop:37233 length:1233 start_codon:yes stop_codon:yes gene_type:complete